MNRHYYQADRMRSVFCMGLEVRRVSWGSLMAVGCNEFEFAILEIPQHPGKKIGVVSFVEMASIFTKIFLFCFRR